jgi:osmotically-inducible protein OsmY
MNRVIPTRRTSSSGQVRSGDPERDWILEERAAHETDPQHWSARNDVNNDVNNGLSRDFSVPASTSYRGRGPKNYRRSDERLREIICELLTDDPFIDATDVIVEVSEGEVSVFGTVATRSQRRAIETLVLHLHGVTELHDQLALRSEELSGA